MPLTIIVLAIGDLALGNSYNVIKGDEIGLYIPNVGYLRRNPLIFQLIEPMNYYSKQQYKIICQIKTLMERVPGQIVHYYRANQIEPDDKVITISMIYNYLLIYCF